MRVTSGSARWSFRPFWSPSEAATLLRARHLLPRYLEATFSVREGTTGITVDAQTSGDLIVWQTQTPLSTISQGDNTAIVTVRDSEPQSAGTKRFIRVKVTSP